MVYGLIERAAVLVSIVGCCAFISGCGGSGRPTLGTPNVVQLKAWIVLAPGESVGVNDNIGCRLTHQDVGAYISQLQTNASMFSPNIQFQWSGSASVASDTRLGKFPTGNLNRTQDSGFWTSQQFSLLENFFDPARVNLYFVGNVQPYPNQDTQFSLAATVDPAAGAAPCPFPSPAFIRINDGGYDGAFGFIHSANVIRGWNVLEHEMAHWLGRFGGIQTNCIITARMFPTTGSSYNQGEHDVASGVGGTARRNILRDGGNVTLGAFPLFMPGAAGVPATERHEVSNRLMAGQWNIP